MNRALSVGKALQSTLPRGERPTAPLLQRFKSNRIIKRIRTMAGVLIRELERKLPREALVRYAEKLQLFKRVHGQKRTDKNKVDSLHEPDVLCIGKGKEHKKYEFGRKAVIDRPNGASDVHP